MCACVRAGARHHSRAPAPALLNSADQYREYVSGYEPRQLAVHNCIAQARSLLLSTEFGTHKPDSGRGVQLKGYETFQRYEAPGFPKPKSPNQARGELRVPGGALRRRLNPAHLRQSRPDSGRGVQVKGHGSFQGDPFSQARGELRVPGGARHHHSPRTRPPRRQGFLVCV